jgi:tetratricopeptide (TPR) repeat protein
MAEEKSRKELLEEPDPFMVFVGKTMNFVKTYQQQIIMAVIAVVLVAVVVSGVVYFRHKAEDRAAAMFGKAVLKYQAARQDKEGSAAFENVKGDLKAVIDQYGSTSAGRAALIKLGDVSFELKQYDEAVDAYLTALHAFRDQDLFAGLIHSGLAYAYEAKGDMDAAAQHFNQVLSDPDAVGKDHALFNLARIYQQQGRADQRKAVLERLVNDYPNSVFYQLAAEMLAGPVSAAARAVPVPMPTTDERSSEDGIPQTVEDPATSASGPEPDQVEDIPASPEPAESGEVSGPPAEPEGDVEIDSPAMETP